MGLAAMSYDPVPVLAEFAARRGITFPLLSDAGSATIRRYGLLNTAVPESNELYGYPFPGTFILNRAAIVTSRFFEDAYQERDTMTSVLVRLGERVDVPATKISAPHLEITTFATDRIAAPGTHFSLVLDIAPGKRVHVYAPGASGYRPVALTVQPQADLVVKAAHFPTAEDYFFRPLNEHVPVFSKPFRLVQDLVLDPSREAEAALQAVKTMIINASLQYQACDDKVCFIPQTVPLSWTIDIRPLDRQRVPKR
jgi:AhpC/TSA family/Disulphide bond corrector protein DsbC